MSFSEIKSNVARRARPNESSSLDTSLNFHRNVERMQRVVPNVRSPDEISLRELLANKLLKSLPDVDFARLVPHLEPVTLQAGKSIYRPEEKIYYGYFPETAVISHLQVLLDGSMIETDMVGRDGLVGLNAVFGSLPSRCSAQVSISGNALRINSEILEHEFRRGGALQKILLGYANACIAQLAQKAVCNGLHNVEKRLCTWLLMVQDRCSEQQLPLTHEVIADYLGVRRAGITCALTALRDRGIISGGRGQINILNRLALEISACECYRRSC